MQSNLLRVTFLAVAVPLFAACTSQIQTTSGETFLQNYSSAVQVPAPGTGAVDVDVDAEVRDAAAVEPILKFPARIGLAYVRGGYLVPVPAAHTEGWHAAMEKAGTRFGQFVPVSPLVAALAADSAKGKTPVAVRAAGGYPYRYGGGDLAETVRVIRLAAARQHLDAVLVYETAAKTGNSATPLSALNISIIGLAVVPANFISADAVAQGLLLDVRNGYPYGTVSTVGTDYSMSTWSNTGPAQRDAAFDAEAEAAANLGLEAIAMMDRLKTALEKKQSAVLR